MEDTAPRFKKATDMLDCRNPTIRNQIVERAEKTLQARRDIYNQLLVAGHFRRHTHFEMSQIAELNAEIAQLERLLPLPSWEAHADYLIGEIASLPDSARTRVMAYIDASLGGPENSSPARVQVRLSQKEKQSLAKFSRELGVTISEVVRLAIDRGYSTGKLPTYRPDLQSLDEKVFARISAATKRRLSILTSEAKQPRSKILRSAILTLMSEADQKDKGS